MAFVKPSRPQYNPEQDLKVAGQFFAQCVRVEQGMPWDKYPGKTLIAIEFEVQDDRFPRERGKRSAIVCGESIFFDKKTGKKSALYQHACLMGVKQPGAGFDPEVEFLDKWYYITTEVDPAKHIAYVRNAIPMPTPQGGKPTMQAPTDTVDVDPPHPDVPF